MNLLGVLVVVTALHLQPSTASAQGAGYTLLTTFTNPTPASYEWFGCSIASVGTDRILIGAEGDNAGGLLTGAAYLFSTNGALLVTFTNPTPTAGEAFGHCVASAGNDRVLIGTSGGGDGSGAAYLFSAGGALLVTFTNPTPAAEDFFGFALASLGADRVLIGALGDDAGATNAGTAYLFSANEAILTTFTNPTPAVADWFGYSLAAVGTDWALIGAPYDDTGANNAGAAYLFNTNGALLTTFTNPIPAANDNFGCAVAAMGSDRVLIGAIGDGSPHIGAAYLFSTNGVLLTTFTNPTPAYGDHFGASLVAVGSDRVLIGASGDLPVASGDGAAYLFTTNGELLATFTNSTPDIGDYFGASVAAAGSDRVLIGARGANHFGGGEAYLFALTVPTPETPSLAIWLTTTNSVVVSWPSPPTGWTLQENTTGVASVNWSNVTRGIQDDGTNKSLIVNPPTGNRFYRLFKP